MQDNRLDNLSLKIKQFIELSDGWFSSRDLDYELNIDSDSEKNLRRFVIKSLIDQGRLESGGTKGGKGRFGLYRLLGEISKEIDWQAANTKNLVKLKWPFQLENFVKIYPKSIVILAGEKNAGKTAFLYGLVLMNMENFVIDLYNSETGPEQMKQRFDNFNQEIPNPAPWRTLERYDNYADVIHPNHISIIDYLDLNSEVYLVGDEIDKIFRKLDKGVAIIALQKPAGRDLAYGAGFTIKRAVLYLSMYAYPHQLKIVSAKNPANAKTNPNNKRWQFILKDGAIFDKIQEVWG